MTDRNVGWLLVVLFAILMASLAAILGGCAVYQPVTIEEWLTQAKQLDGSGCVYVRGNARPYADVSMLAVHTYGKNAPKYKECLEAIPPDARNLLP